jgi:hypothetical protein
VRKEPRDRPLDGDGLHVLVLDLSTTQRRLVDTGPGVGTGLRFSPDGSEVLHGFDGCGLRLTPLATGKSLVVFSQGPNNRLGDVRWSDEGLQLLYYDREQRAGGAVQVTSAV